MSNSFLIDPKKVNKIVKGSGPILIVEDDDDQVFLLRRCYDKAERPNQIVVLSNGDELIEYMQNVILGMSALPELILLDINMPGKDGFQALEKIKTYEEFSKTPHVVMVTGSEVKADIEKAKKLGAYSYWKKPKVIEEYVSFFKDI